MAALLLVTFSGAWPSWLRFPEPLDNWPTFQRLSLAQKPLSRSMPSDSGFCFLHVGALAFSRDVFGFSVRLLQPRLLDKEACAGPTQTFVRPDTRATGYVGEVGNEFRPTSVRGRTPTPSPVK
jgi:hypothetical protein